MQRAPFHLGKLSCTEALLLVPALLLAVGYEILGVPLGKSGIPIPVPAFIGSIPHLQLKLFPMEMFLAWVGLITLAQSRRWPRTGFWNRATFLAAGLVALVVLRMLPDLRANPILVVRNGAFGWYLLLSLLVALYPVPSSSWEKLFRVYYAVCFAYFALALAVPFLQQDLKKLSWPLDIGFSLALAYGLTAKRRLPAALALGIIGFAIGMSFFFNIQRTMMLGLGLVTVLLLGSRFFPGRFPPPRWARAGWFAAGIGAAVFAIAGLGAVPPRHNEASTSPPAPQENAQEIWAVHKSETNDSGVERFRLYLWNDAWDAFSSAPLTGIGFLRPVVYRVYGGQGYFFDNDGGFEAKSLNRLDKTPSPPVAGPHNSYLNALTRLGVLGLGVFLLHLICAAFFLERGYFACLFILLGQMLYAFFNVGLEGPVHSFPLLLLVGVGLKISIENSARRTEHSPAPKRARRSGVKRLGLVHVPYRIMGGEDMHVATLTGAYRTMGFEPVPFPEPGVIAGPGSAGRALTLGEPAYWDARSADGSLDFLHLHNIHPNFGPAFLRWIIERRIPTLMTVHNHRFYCTNGLALHGAEVCKDCRTSASFVRPLLRNCNGSFSKTAYHSAAISEIRGEALLQRAVTKFLAPSPYIAKELQAAGISPSQIELFPHPVNVDAVERAAEAEACDVAFVGRLSAEKGVILLLEAARRMPDRRFDIVGEGPIEDEIRATAASLKNVRFHGRLARPAALAVMKAAKVVCVPSVCHESFSLVAAEALALGARLVVPYSQSFLHYAEPPFNAVNAIIMNPESLLYSLDQALEQPARSAAETAAIRERFNVQTYQSKLGTLIERVVYQ